MLATKSNSYTFQKDGIWYFSRRVPADLRRHYRTGRISNIIFSTIFIIVALFAQPVFAGVDEGVDVQKVQTMLTELCFRPGPVDGVWGKKTERAAEQFFDKYWDGYEGQFTESEFAKLNQFNIEILRNINFGVKTLKRCAVAKPSNKASVKVKQNQSEKIHFFDESCCEIPDKIDWQPNDATLEYYYRKTAELRLKTSQMYKVNPTSNPRKFKKQIKSHETIDREMAKSTILSYLYYDDGIVVYDALPPKDRFQYKFTDKSYFPSHSMGKSITSYLVGHAVCQGYISSVDAPIQDWPLMENTLYYGQPLINLLNMKAGDTHVIKKYDGNFIKTGRNIHGNAPLMKAVWNSLELKDTSARSSKRYAYSNLTADIIFNYMMHRIGNDFERFIKDFYQNKVKIEHPVYLWMNPLMDHSWSPTMGERIKQGAGQYGISATRYDFLRIAKAMMDDWQNDTCEGKYLKEMYNRRIWKNDASDKYSKTYSAQFHSDIQRLKGGAIFALIGYNGQKIMIDMDNSRIVVIGAVKSLRNAEWKLSHEPIIYGFLR
jgi:CubicO group peptidase (beta-lactamase class C family)